MAPPETNYRGYLSILLFKANGIEYISAEEDNSQAREPVTIEDNGMIFAFLGHNDV